MNGIKRNSKSNVQIKFKQRIEAIAQNSTQVGLRTRKNQNTRFNIHKGIKDDSKRANNFINSFDLASDEGRRKTFNAYSESKNIIIDKKEKLSSFHQNRSSSIEKFPQDGPAKIDNNIVEMMKILGYKTEDIYSGLSQGNQHLNNVYSKLLSEKKDAAKFLGNISST